MELSGNESVAILAIDTGNGYDTFNSFLYNFEDSDVNSYWNYPFHMNSVRKWESEAGKAELTVADLADSIEAMLARRESGLSAPTTIMQMRQYPTDPSTQRSASAFLQQIQDDGKKQLAELDAEYKASKQAKAEAKAKAEADAKAYAEFKASQQAKTS